MNVTLKLGLKLLFAFPILYHYGLLINSKVYHIIKNKIEGTPILKLATVKRQKFVENSRKKKLVEKSRKKKIRRKN